MQDLIELILAEDNLEQAIWDVYSNKGAPGVDGMTVYQLKECFEKNKELIKTLIRMKQYKPLPVKRVYIPKPNSDKKRPLGIPTVIDRVIQQAVARVLMDIYDPKFSNYSYGYRPGRDCHMAVKQALEYLNEGRNKVVDFDIEKFFDTVNHDKLISILRETVKDDTTLHLIRAFLKAGVMEEGLVGPTEEGLPQGGPLSCVLSNVYLDKLDKELERRELAFVRYADDFCIYVKSDKAAERVLVSVSSWIERKLFLKVSATKTKIVPPSQSEYLGFGFWNGAEGWKCRPLPSRKARLVDKIRAVTCRRKAAAVPIFVTVSKVNSIVKGWINYYGVGSMMTFMKRFGAWMRHRIRVIFIKQWKTPQAIMRKLKWFCNHHNLRFSDFDLYRVAHSSRGLYAKASNDIVNCILSPDILAEKIRVKVKGENKTVYPGLVNPVKYYSHMHDL